MNWKIVVGHHPAFSGGMHGASWGLIRYLADVLESSYGVRRLPLLNGHDHDLQHVAVDGIHYLTSGGGPAEPRTVAELPASGSLFSRSTLGFMAATPTKLGLRLPFVGAGMVSRCTSATVPNEA